MWNCANLQKIMFESPIIFQWTAHSEKICKNLIYIYYFVKMLNAIKLKYKYSLKFKLLDLDYIFPADESVSSKKKFFIKKINNLSGVYRNRTCLCCCFILKHFWFSRICLGCEFQQHLPYKVVENLTTSTPTTAAENLVALISTFQNLLTPLSTQLFKKTELH